MTRGCVKMVNFGTAPLGVSEPLKFTTHLPFLLFDEIGHIAVEKTAGAAPQGI